MEQNEILWRQYQQNVELYKFYMELVVKFNVFYYAVTGAILSFFFAHPDIPKLKFSLVLPLVMSVAFGAFFVYGAVLMRGVREDTFEMRDKLNLNVAPRRRSVVRVIDNLFNCIRINRARMHLHIMGVLTSNMGDGVRRLTASFLHCRSGQSPSSATHRQR